MVFDGILLCSRAAQPQPSECPVLKWNINRWSGKHRERTKPNLFSSAEDNPSSGLCSSTQELHPAEGELLHPGFLPQQGHSSRDKPSPVLSVNVLARLSWALWSNTPIFSIRHNCSHANGFWELVEQQRKSQTFSSRDRTESLPFPYPSLSPCSSSMSFCRLGVQTMRFLFRKSLIFLPKNNRCASISRCSEASLTPDPRYPLAVKTSLPPFLFWS